MSVSNEFTYRAKVKGKEIWQRYDRVRFGISVGMPYHEGEKLQAALDWAKSRFRRIEIRVSDTLQRYNMPGTPEQNERAARTMGDAWIDRNLHVLAQVPNALIYRWDDVRLSPDMAAHYNMVDDKLADPVFRAAMQGDIDAYTRRTGRAGDICLAYLREELAVFSLLQTMRPAVEAYPGSFLECRGLLRPDFALVRIHFERVPKVERYDLAA